MTARESLALILSEAAHEAGGWRKLEEQTGVNFNSLFRYGHPDSPKTNGQPNQKTLPRPETLLQIMEKLDLVFARALGPSRLLDVTLAIDRLDIDDHTRRAMKASVRAIWGERE